MLSMPAPMFARGGARAIEFIGSATGTSSISSLPPHIAGDLLIIGIFDNSSTERTEPAGWTNLIENGGDGISMTVAYYFAVNSSTAPPLSSGASSMVVMIFRGVASIGGSKIFRNDDFDGYVYPELVMSVSDGTSAVVAFGGADGGGIGAKTPPPGMSFVNSIETPSGSIAAHRTPAPVASWSRQTVAGDPEFTLGATVELVKNP